MSRHGLSHTLLGDKSKMWTHVCVSVDAENTTGVISCLCRRMGDKKGPGRLLSFTPYFHLHFLYIRRMLSAAYT